MDIIPDDRQDGVGEDLFIFTLGTEKPGELFHGGQRLEVRGKVRVKG